MEMEFTDDDFTDDDYKMASKCLANCDPDLKRLGVKIQGFVKEIEVMKKARWLSMAKQKERYQLCVDAVRDLSNKFKRLQHLIKHVKLDCQKAQFPSVESIESIAFAQENLTKTVHDIDRYREIPTIVSNLSQELNRNPVDCVPRANYEHRVMMSWSYLSQEEWKAARLKYGQGKTKDYNNMARLVEEHTDKANKYFDKPLNVIGGISESSKQLINLLWGRDNKGLIYAAINQCFHLSKVKPNYLILIADIIETNHRQNQMIQTLVKKIKDLGKISSSNNYGGGSDSDSDSGSGSDAESSFDPFMLEQEVTKRSQNQGLGNRDARKKCINNLIQAASKHYYKMFTKGVIQYIKEIDGGITDNQIQIVRSKDYEFDFDEMMAGFSCVSENILIDTDSVAICFPPWYNIRELFIEAYSIESVAMINRHIFNNNHQNSNVTGEMKNEESSSSSGGGGGGDSSSSSSNRQDGKVNERISSKLNLSNDRIMLLVDWLRMTANNFEKYSESHNKNQSKLDRYYFSNLKRGFNDGTGKFYTVCIIVMI
jgi:hypothetical protein